jgi:hypothetical protein
MNLYSCDKHIGYSSKNVTLSSVNEAAYHATNPIQSEDGFVNINVRETYLFRVFVEGSKVKLRQCLKNSQCSDQPGYKYFPAEISLGESASIIGAARYDENKDGVSDIVVQTTAGFLVFSGHQNLEICL